MSEVAVAGHPRRAAAPSATKRHALRDLAVEIIAGTNAYQALAADWTRLGELQSGASLFQTHALLSTWGRHFAHSRKLATIVVRRERRVVLIWPLVIERRGLIRVACGAGGPIGQYDEALIDPEADGRAALSAALDVLVSAERPDIVLLERVRADSRLCAALSETAPLCSGEAAPYTDLSRGMGAVLSNRRGNTARNQRKRIKRFEGAGESAFAVARDPVESEAWLLEALALKRDWLRETGRMSRAFVQGRTVSCLTDLARTMSHADAQPRLVVSRLSLDGRTAAIEAGFLHRGSYHLYLGAFAPEFSKRGPGNILTQRVLEWCTTNGIERYDMLAPRSRHKSEWQSGEVGVVDFAVPTTLRGRLYAELVLKRLAPSLRAAFYALPARLRSAVAGVALRM